MFYADLMLIDDQLKIYALAGIKLNLQNYDKSLFDYHQMPRTDLILIPDMQNILIHDELECDMRSLADEHVGLMSTITLEQQKVYEKL